MSRSAEVDASDAGALARLEALRTVARTDGATALAAAGFEAASDGTWRGALPGLPDAGRVRVALPSAFPDALPEVFVDRATLPRRIPHVEPSGKVCLAPGSGVLLDASRPDALVRDALARAVGTVGAGLRGETDGDLRREFLAYWRATGGKAFSLCAARGPARRVARARLGAFGGVRAGAILLTDAAASATAWARAVGTTATPDGDAFLVPLAAAFDPPEFDVPLTVRDVQKLVDECAEPVDAAAFRAWLSATALPATVVFALPEPEVGVGRPVVAVRLPAPRGDAAKRASAGFRPGQASTARRLGFGAGEPVERVDLARVDPEFLRARGGAAAGLARRTATVVGAGSVGSEIAVQLAALGVGRLILVDHDEMRPENVHRHALGVASVGRPKASALAEELARRFPHLDVGASVSEAFGVLEHEPALLTGVDLLILATGEETLERRLNDVLAGGPPRVHAWVEPLGIAGHALACGRLTPDAPGAPGCYECLFETRAEVGPVNRAALTAPGQDVARSVAGCAGTFSPFSTLDARRTALEAAELAARVLSGVETAPTLVTWRGERPEFEATSLRTSPRARVVPVGGRVRIPGAAFAQPGCPVCGPARGATARETS